MSISYILAILDNPSVLFETSVASGKITDLILP